MYNTITKQRDYAKRYRKTPYGAAACAWNRLTSRAGGKYGHRKCYQPVEVRMTRDEFMAWAVPEYEAWFRDNPGITPSIDRKEGKGHYAISNLRIISLDENRLGASWYKNRFAPEGMAWCGPCQRYLPVEGFDTTNGHTKNGLTHRCKDCRRSGRRVRSA